MARNDPTIYMRIPQGLKDSLDKSAEENKRSMTAEVVARLQASFDTRPAMGKTGSEDTTREAKQADDIAERVVERLEATKLTPLPMSGEYMEAIEKMLAAAHERHRQWWVTEFGYDPDAPPVERVLSKGPTMSENAKKRAPPRK